MPTETPTPTRPAPDAIFARKLTQNLTQALLHSVGEDGSMDDFEAFLNATMVSLANIPAEARNRMKALYEATDGIAKDGAEAADRRHALDVLATHIAYDLSLTDPYAAALLFAHMELTDADMLIDFYGNL